MVSLDSVPKSWSATVGRLRCGLPGVLGLFGAGVFGAVGARNVLQRKSLAGLVVQCGTDEGGEQRMRPGRPALEFRVSLGADQERVHVRAVLDELDEVPVR